MMHKSNEIMWNLRHYPLHSECPTLLCVCKRSNPNIIQYTN